MYTLTYQQMLPISPEECWNFFSSPANLKLITPDSLGFRATNVSNLSRMYAGQLITHSIKPFPFLTFEWITEITHVQEPLYFIDEQRFGPYKFWHHEHRFVPTAKGIEMTDLVNYKMPFGILGQVIHQIQVKKDLEKIFAFRKQALENIFGKVI